MKDWQEYPLNNVDSSYSDFKSLEAAAFRHFHIYEGATASRNVVSKLQLPAATPRIYRQADGTYQHKSERHNITLVEVIKESSKLALLLLACDLKVGGGKNNQVSPLPYRLDPPRHLNFFIIPINFLYPAPTGEKADERDRERGVSCVTKKEKASLHDNRHCVYINF